jgi:hypothetical protein
VASTLARAAAVDDEWVLLRGYRDSNGGIDAVPLGLRGLFTIEE